MAEFIKLGKDIKAGNIGPGKMARLMKLGRMLQAGTFRFPEEQATTAPQVSGRAARPTARIGRPAPGPRQALRHTFPGAGSTGIAPRGTPTKAKTARPPGKAAPTRRKSTVYRTRGLRLRRRGR